METQMTLRPMTAAERKYSYSQSQQLTSQTGCIGHLRAYFDRDGQFSTSWDDHRGDLKSPEFGQELKEVIHALREDGQYEGILKDRGSLAAYCWEYSESSFGNDREYGFRVDTPQYSYLLRLNPNRGEYNAYFYCYVRQWLDRHMQRAEKGIRFITPEYREKFRISDGEKIRMTDPSGEVWEQPCRYIDETHLEVGGNLYHIREFAERMQRNGVEVIPLRSDLPEKCFSILESTGEIIVITKGENGYGPTRMFPQSDDPREGVAALNAAGAVTRAQEAAMVAGSMFGWDTPAADPKNYDENGTPIRPKARERGDSR